MYKIGINTEGWYNEDNPEESIRYVAECGIEAIDYDICALFSHTFDLETMTSFFDQDMDDLKKYYDRMIAAMKKYNIVFSQWHGIFPIYYPDDTARTEYLLKMTDKMIELCAYAGCPAIVMHSWTGVNLPKQQELEINMELYRRMIPAAKKFGVKICLENLFKHSRLDCVEGSCADVSEAIWYIDTLNKEAGEDVFAFCLDTGHANLLSKNLYQYITSLGDRLMLLHINDNTSLDDYHMIPYTQLDRGCKVTSIDWDGFLRALKETGYKGDLNFETHKGIKMLPDEVRQDGIRLICSIGRYFKKKIEG